MTGCGGRERFAAEPCQPLSEVARVSGGFEPDEPDEGALAESHWASARWDRVEWLDGSVVLFGIEKAMVDFGGFGSHITSFTAHPLQNFSVTAIEAHLGAHIRAVRGAGFKLISGDEAEFLRAAVGTEESERHLVFLRDDYEIDFILWISDDQKVVHPILAGRSHGRCRSPEMRAFNEKYPLGD